MLSDAEGENSRRVRTGFGAARAAARATKATIRGGRALVCEGNNCTALLNILVTAATGGAPRNESRRNCGSVAAKWRRHFEKNCLNCLNGAAVWRRFVIRGSTVERRPEPRPCHCVGSIVASDAPVVDRATGGAVRVRFAYLSSAEPACLPRHLLHEGTLTRG
jgi:hypothetical protein